MKTTITSTKGTRTIETQADARAFFAELQPSYADIGGVEVAAAFDGSRRYWLSDGDSSLDLGDCEHMEDLAEAVAQCLLAGADDTDWTGWEVQ